jgi:hypothetical protein
MKDIKFLTSYLIDPFICQAKESGDVLSCKVLWYGLMVGRSGGSMPTA